MNSDIAYFALEKAMAHGADAARVLYREDRSSNFSLLNTELDSIKESSSSSVIIQIFKDSRYGEFSSNILRPEVFDDFIRQAVKSTLLLSPDECRTLPQAERYYKGPSADLGQCDEAYSRITAAEKRKLLERLDRTPDSNIIATTDVYEDSDESLVMADSQGFFGESRMTYYSIYSECALQGKGDARPEGFWQENSLKFNDISLNSAKEAYRRAASMADPRKVRTGNYPVILENNIAMKFVRPLLSALNGAAIQQRNSFLLDTAGKKIFPDRLSLYDRPHLYGAITSRFFDSEGIATSDMDIIKDGMICNYFLNTYYAKKTGMPATIEGASVPVLKPFGLEDKESMIRSLDKGLLITGFNGGNSNSATGDFSYGIEGFYIENGQRVHPVKEMNITGNFIDIWNRIMHIGTDIRENSVNRMPSLCFESASISGL